MFGSSAHKAGACRGRGPYRAGAFPWMRPPSGRNSEESLKSSGPDSGGLVPIGGGGSPLPTPFANDGSETPQIVVEGEVGFWRP